MSSTTPFHERSRDLKDLFGGDPKVNRERGKKGPKKQKLSKKCVFGSCK